MAWDCAEPDFQRKFDWIDKFVADELHPLEPLRACLDTDDARRVLEPVKQQVRQIWACGA
jgi:hypothetical protein